jgi:RNA polymerase sigma-70 factor (ECF subfamily)
MESDAGGHTFVAGGASQFATTHWSVVLAAGKTPSPASAAALERLCRTYWYPLYAYVRRRGYGGEEAQDLTQEFFCRLLERHAFEHLRREGGKLRSFLLTALKHFLVSEWEHRCARKRDERRIVLSLDALDAQVRYRLEPADETNPELLYERRWAEALLGRVLNQLDGEYTVADKADLFQHLRPCLTGAEPALPYAAFADQLGLTEAAVKMAVHRLRRRYGELLRAELEQLVGSPEEVDEEIRHLIAITTS